MDGRWHLPWRSTVAKFNQDLLKEYAEFYTYLQSPSSKDIGLLKEVIQNQTLLLKWRDFSAWPKRGKALLTLQYPDLAAGDLYKALELAEGSNKERALLLLGQALFMANSFRECIQLVDQATTSDHELKRLRVYAQASLHREKEENGTLGSSEEDISGEIVAQIYPWLKPAWTLRRSSVLTAANEELKIRSGRQCEVRRSDINSANQDCYGIFATAAMSKGDRVFDEPTTICATSGATRRCACCGGKLVRRKKLECCETRARFCSWACVKRAQTTYHRALCSQTLDNSNGKTGDLVGTAEGANKGLWLRAVAVIKQAMDSKPWSCKHPLDVPLVNQLSLKCGTVLRFSLRRDNVEPTKTLQKLGVDTFDLNYDTWVLRTIAGRMANNVRECMIDTDHAKEASETRVLAINPLYSWLNHSCRPNAEVFIGDGKEDGTLYLHTRSKVRKGEELCISYLDEERLAGSHEERAELLKFWTGGICNCPKCCKERRKMDQDERGR